MNERLIPADVGIERVLWLFTMEWAGHTIRLCDDEVDVDTDDGRVLHYEAGLGDIEVTEAFPLISSSAVGQISVPIASPFPVAVNVPRLVAMGHDLASARGELSRWVEGSTWESRRIVLTGALSDPEYETKDSPVNFSLESLVWRDTALIAGPLSKVLGVTWAHADSLDVKWLNVSYPIVFGRPGRVSTRVAPLGRISGSQGVWVDYRRGTPLSPNHTNIMLVIAGHHVGVTRVIAATDAAPAGVRLIVRNGLDELGNPVAWVPFFATFNGVYGVDDKDYNVGHGPYTFTTTDTDGTTAYGIGAGAAALDSFNDSAAPAEVSISWLDELDPEAGGLEANGRLVREAGDVLSLILGRTTAPLDRGRITAINPALARFRFDGVIPRPHEYAPWKWLQESILPLLPIAIVSGSAGMYWLMWRPSATRADATIHFNLDSDPEIERLGPIRYNAQDRVNLLTLEYAYSYRTKTYATSVTLGAVPGDAPDGAGVHTFRTHPLCALSRARTERTMEWRLQSPFVYEDATAWAIVEAQAAIRCLPTRELVLDVPEATYIHTERGAIALVTDSETYLDEDVWQVGDVKTDGSGYLKVQLIRFERAGELGRAG